MFLQSISISPWPTPTRNPISKNTNLEIWNVNPLHRQDTRIGDNHWRWRAKYPYFSYSIAGRVPFQLARYKYLDGRKEILPVDKVHVPC
jgi:hypothetical protein